MMRIDIRHSGSPLLLALGCVVLVSTSSSRCDPPAAADAEAADARTAQGKEPDDSLAPPFLCVLPDYYPATNNPEWFVRWAQTDEAGDWRLAAYTTQSGIHVLHRPDAPLTEPGPEVIGACQKGYADHVLRLLHALSPEQRVLLAQGEIVDITNARAVVSEFTSRDPEGAASGGFDEETLSSCPYLAAALAVVPAVELRAGTGATGGVCDVAIRYSREPGTIHVLQPRAGGLTFWSDLARPNPTAEQGQPEWDVRPWHLSGPSRNVTATVLPELLRSLDGADSASLDDIDGMKLGALIEGIGKRSGLGLSASDACASRVVFARGGDVSALALAEALFASGRLGIRLTKPDGAPVVFPDPAQAHAASIQLAELARERIVPEVTAELRSLLSPALERPYLSKTPIALSRFADGFQGSVSDLSGAEATWLESAVRQVQATYADIPVFDREWLAARAPLVVRLRLEFHLTVAACVPYRKPDPATRNYVPAIPPEWYYTALAASRDRPFLSTIPLQLRAY